MLHASPAHSRGYRRAAQPLVLPWFPGLIITRRDDPPSPRLRRDNTTSPVPLRVHQRRRVHHKEREPARRRRYDGRGNIPTLTIQRVGHPAAWIGPRASFRVAPLRCVESDTYRNFKDGPPAWKLGIRLRPWANHMPAALRRQPQIGVGAALWIFLDGLCPAIGELIEFYNQRRYHEGIGNVASVRLCFYVDLGRFTFNDISSPYSRRGGTTNRTKYRNTNATGKDPISVHTSHEIPLAPST